MFSSAGGRGGSWGSSKRASSTLGYVRRRGASTAISYASGPTMRRLPSTARRPYKMQKSMTYGQTKRRAYADKSITMGYSASQHSRENKPVIVRHREYITDITTSTLPFVQRGPGNTTNLGYRLNPAASSTFAWLSNIATNFEQYKFLKLKFEYVPTCGEVGSTTGGNNALGSVMMAIEYNSLQPVAQNKQSLLEQMWSVSGKPTEYKCMSVDVKPSHTPMDKLFIQQNVQTTGNTQCAVLNCDLV